MLQYSQRNTHRHLISLYYIKRYQHLLQIPSQSTSQLETEVFNFENIPRHPYALRAFKDSLQLKQTSTVLSNLQKLTLTSLNTINQSLKRRRQQPSHQNRPLQQSNDVWKSLEETTRIFESTIPSVLHRLHSLDDIKTLIALVGVLLPSSPPLWSLIDKSLTTHLFTFSDISDSSSSFQKFSTTRIVTAKDFETALFASYLLHKAKKPSSSSSNNQQQTTNDFLTTKFTFQHFQRLKPFVTFEQSTVEVEDGTKTVWQHHEVLDVKSLEILSLQLHLYAQQTQQRKQQIEQSLSKNAKEVPYHYLKIQESQLHRLERGFLRHTLGHLSGEFQQPIPLSTLRYIWESLASINLFDKDDIYKELYQKVSNSITNDPSQLNHSEATICSLLESMIQSKVKSSNLIHRLCDHFLSLESDGNVLEAEEGAAIEEEEEDGGGRGIGKGSWNYYSYGMRLFRALISLDALPYAANVLGTVINNAGVNLEKLLIQADRDQKAFQLPTSAKGELIQLLSNTSGLLNKTASSSLTIRPLTNDLIVALLCFHREEDGSAYHLLFERLEESFTKKVLNGDYTPSSKEVIGLLRCYSFVGRRPVPLFRKLFQLAIADLSNATAINLSTLLWICARLNHRPGKDEEDFIEKIFQVYAANLSKKDGQISLISVYWSLSVLRQLTFQRFQRFQTSFYQIYEQASSASQRRRENVSSSGNSLVRFRMISQIYNELSIVLKRKQNDSSESVKKEAEILAKLQKLVEREAERLKDYRLQKNYTISLAQQATSQLLTLQDIHHESEKLLPNHYQVDIFIPYNENHPWSEFTKKDIVLEIDGPSHFESFKQTALGPAVMKKRHIQAAGYLYVSLRLKTYYQLTYKEKYKYLKMLIRQVASKEREGNSKTTKATKKTKKEEDDDDEEEEENSTRSKK